MTKLIQVCTMRISLSLLMPLLFLLLLILALQPARAESKYNCPPRDFSAEQKEYLQKSTETQQRMKSEGTTYEEQRMAGRQLIDSQNAVHLAITTGMQYEWKKQWEAAAPERAAHAKTVDEQRQAHQTAMAQNPDKWYSTCNYSKQ